MLSLGSEHTRKANLKFLRSVDPDIVQIVFSTHHAAVYVLEMPEQKWYSKGVKGPLFVVKRTKAPHFLMLGLCLRFPLKFLFKFKVLNRIQPKTLLEPITSGIVMQNTQSYLLYQNTSGHVNGLWLYDEAAKTTLFSLIQK